MARFHLFFIVIFSVFITGCAAPGDRYIRINPPPFGAQFIPGQLNTILVDNGFNRIEFSARISDPNAGMTDALNMKTGMVLESSRKLFMRYQHQIFSDLLIDVIIGRDKGEVELKFYEVEKKELSAPGINIYNQFKENLASGIYDENDFTAD